MSTCTLVDHSDFEWLFRDGSTPAFVYSVPMVGSFNYSNGGFAETEVYNSDGTISQVYAPRKGQQNLTTWTLDARMTGGMGGANTAIPTLTLDITHAASVDYYVELDVTRAYLGESSPTRHVVEWASGVDAAATATAAIAALTALFGSGATGSGDVTLAFPEGTIVDVISDDMGTGTVAASVAYTGGTVSAELVLIDLINRSGQYGRLQPTIPTQGCRGGHAVFDFGCRAGGKDYWFPLSTWSGTVTTSLEGTTIAVQGRSRVAYPEVIDTL